MRALQREKHSRWTENPCGYATLEADARPRNPKADGTDTILANPESSSILLEHSISSLLSHRLLFLRSVPALSPRPPRSLASLTPVASALATYIAVSPLNLIRSLPVWFPRPPGVGYSVTMHERRLISIPATPPFPPSLSLPDLSFPRRETSTDLRRCWGTCGKSLAGFRNTAHSSLLSSLKSHQLCRINRIGQAATDSPLARSILLRIDVPGNKYNHFANYFLM